MRMLIQSHPLIASQKRYITCTLCGKRNHSISSCPNRITSVTEKELSEILDIYQWKLASDGIETSLYLLVVYIKLYFKHLTNSSDIRFLVNYPDFT